MANSRAVLLGRQDLPSGTSLTIDDVRGIMSARSTPRSSPYPGGGGLLPRVLVVYTGGTIGMMAGPNVCMHIYKYI